MINITLPITPVPKGRPRFARAGKFIKTYTPYETKKFEQQVLLLSKRSKPKEPLQGALSVGLYFYMPIPKVMRGEDLEKAMKELLYHTKKPDCDNLAKAILDAFNGVFWIDDSQIASLVIKKVYSKDPRINVFIDFAEQE